MSEYRPPQSSVDEVLGWLDRLPHLLAVVPTALGD